MAKKKNAAAVALATKRWAGKTAAEKRAVGAALHAAAAVSGVLTPEFCEERAKKAAAARWAGHKKAKKPAKTRG